LALQGLEDMRETISRGVATANAYFFASTMCAAELHDRGNPVDDPLNAEGFKYLRLAVVYGYPRSNLTFSPDNLEVRSEWARKIPDDIKVESPPNGCDLNIRLVDPVSD
jgi:hypothetical protein